MKLPYLAKKFTPFVEHNVLYLNHKNSTNSPLLKHKFLVHALSFHFSLRPTFMFHYLPRIHVQSGLFLSCFITITIILHACYTQRPLH